MDRKDETLDTVKGQEISIGEGMIVGLHDFKTTRLQGRRLQYDKTSRPQITL